MYLCVGMRISSDIYPLLSLYKTYKKNWIFISNLYDVRRQEILEKLSAARVFTYVWKGKSALYIYKQIVCMLLKSIPKKKLNK